MATFPILNDFVDTQELDNEWRNHALLNYNDFNLSIDLQAEQYWRKAFQIKNSAGKTLFKNLKVVMGFLLILPFSNASVGRLFSNLNHIKT